MSISKSSLYSKDINSCVISLKTALVLTMDTTLFGSLMHCPFYLNLLHFLLSWVPGMEIGLWEVKHPRRTQWVSMGKTHYPELMREKNKVKWWDKQDERLIWSWHRIKVRISEPRCEAKKETSVGRSGWEAVGWGEPFCLEHPLSLKLSLWTSRTIMWWWVDLPEMLRQAQTICLFRNLYCSLGA